MTGERTRNATVRARCGGLLAAALLLGGCGGSGGDFKPGFGNGVNATGGDALVEDRAAVLAGEEGRNVPIVYIDRRKGTNTHIYRIQGQEYMERELLGLCRALADNDQNATVAIVPSGALSRDEVGLIEAKLREAGIQTIRNLGSQGSGK